MEKKEELISQELLTAMLNYLAERPYKETATMLNTYQIEAAKRNEPVVNKKK